MDKGLHIYEEPGSRVGDGEITFSKIKVCSKCFKGLSLDNFCWADKSKKWRRGDCKKCCREKAISKKWITPNKQYKAQRKWVENNKDEHWFRKLAGRYLGSASKENAALLRNKLEKQGYKCTYTGKLLVLRENCSLDHILPKSRFPEKAKDIDNLEFVDYYVNIAKRDQTKEEFLQMCKDILNNNTIF